MNNWANDQNRNDQDWNRLLNQDWNPDLINQPPNIEVRDSSVYRNGWKVANLVQTDSIDPEDFKEVQETLLLTSRSVTPVPHLVQVLSQTFQTITLWTFCLTTQIFGLTTTA